MNTIRQPLLTAGSLEGVAYAIQGLREMPGRKAIALFSDGFSSSVDEIVELANRASVVIYALDPRGLASMFLSAVDVCRPPQCNIRAEETKRQTAYQISQQGLEELARGRVSRLASANV